MGLLELGRRLGFQSDICANAKSQSSKITRGVSRIFTRSPLSIQARAPIYGIADAEIRAASCVGAVAIIGRALRGTRATRNCNIPSGFSALNRRLAGANLPGDGRNHDR